MPYQAQYAQMGGPKTAIDDILDLDGEAEHQSRSISNKYIRDTMPTRQAMNPEQMMQMRGRLIPNQNAQQNSEVRHPRVVEDYEAADPSIAIVTNRIFGSAGAYIEALDNAEHPLHSVARAVLTYNDPNCDKTVYIIVIIILCIAIACMIYKMNSS